MHLKEKQSLHRFDTSEWPVFHRKTTPQKFKDSIYFINTLATSSWSTENLYLFHLIFGCKIRMCHTRDLFVPKSNVAFWNFYTQNVFFSFIASRLLVFCFRVGVVHFLGKYGIYGIVDGDIFWSKRSKQRTACCPYNIFSTQLNVASRDSVHRSAREKKNITPKTKRKIVCMCQKLRIKLLNELNERTRSYEREEEKNCINKQHI